MGVRRDCRVEFNTGEVCHLDYAQVVAKLTALYGDAWVTDVTTSKKIRTVSLFQERLLAEGELLIWSSKRASEADLTGDAVDAVVRASAGYLVKSETESVRVWTLEAAAHMVVSRPHATVCREGDIPTLSAMERMELEGWLRKHSRYNPFYKPPREVHEVDNGTTEGTETQTS